MGTKRDSKLDKWPVLNLRGTYQKHCSVHATTNTSASMFKQRQHGRSIATFPRSTMTPSAGQLTSNTRPGPISPPTNLTMGLVGPAMSPRMPWQKNYLEISATALFREQLGIDHVNMDRAEWAAFVFFMRYQEITLNEAFYELLNCPRAMRDGEYT